MCPIRRRSISLIDAFSIGSACHSPPTKRGWIPDPEFIAHPVEAGPRNVDGVGIQGGNLFERSELFFPPTSSSTPGCPQGPRRRVVFFCVRFGVHVTLPCKVSEPRAHNAPLANKENLHRRFHQRSLACRGETRLLRGGRNLEPTRPRGQRSQTGQTTPLSLSRASSAMSCGSGSMSGSQPLV